MGTRKMARMPNRQTINIATVMISGFSMANLNINSIIHPQITQMYADKNKSF